MYNSFPLNTGGGKNCLEVCAMLWLSKPAEYSEENQNRKM